jgi:uncharacterized protein (DUF433 family)
MFDSISKRELIREIVGGEAYEYYPLGEYVVMAPGVCGGRPTFKYTRLEISAILAEIAAGLSIDETLLTYDKSQLSRQAIREAIQLADRVLTQTVLDIYPVAA